MGLRRTKVVNAVFPLPLGPTSRKVGRLVDAAACLYSNVCSSIGRPNATTMVMRMVVRFGENAAVSQLSSSYHAMALLYTRRKYLPRRRRVLVNKNSL
jgi:hypothetical protein